MNSIICFNSYPVRWTVAVVWMTNHLWYNTRNYKHANKHGNFWMEVQGWESVLWTAKKSCVLQWVFCAVQLSQHTRLREVARSGRSCSKLFVLLPWTMRWTFVDFGFLFVRMEHTYGPSSWTSTFWILMLYSVTAVFCRRTTRGSRDHFSLPAKRMVVRFSHATLDTLLSTLHLSRRKRKKKY